MYEVSNYSGKVKNTQTNEVFIQDDTIPQWGEFTAWRENGGELIFVECFEEELIELNIRNQTENEFIAYEKRCLDGRIAFNRMNAEFRVLKENGVFEQGYYDAISEILIPIRNEVLAGQWITSLQKLEVIGSVTIGIDLYNRLHLQITNYISENY